MWPKRLIRLVGNSPAGLPGILALLEAFGWDIWSGEQSGWLGRETPPTHLVFWPDVDEHDERIQEAKRLGIPCYPVADFLHKIWNGEVVLSVHRPEAMLGDHPLLWRLLETAGFAPSLVWPTGDGSFVVERGNGGYWVVEASWLDQVVQGAKFGRTLMLTNRGIVWKVQNQRVDLYYRSEEGPTRFIGALPRWSDAREEVRALEAIASGMELGISWRDVCVTLDVPKKLVVVEVESA